jgi:23S rRNA pseudouridine1911/1915/1917 synthase
MSFGDALDILYEDNHCLALNKPAGWPTTHFDGTDETVDRLVKAYLKENYRKPGNVFLGVVHRLDKPVSGVLLFARTSKAAARLSEQFRGGMVEKHYWAVVEDPPSSAHCPWLTADSGSLEDWLKKDDPTARVEVVPESTAGARFARLLFTVRGRHGGLTWLELRPHTGRKHQLRVQLAARGCPIYGDAKYGSDHRFGPAVALHARGLSFLHPTTRDPLTLTADVPAYWKGRFAHLLAERT